MAQAPGGTVTLLFTDLVSSTKLREGLGDDQAEQLRRPHFALLRTALATHGGEEVKTLGDGVMAAFASALDALACAVAMQQAVHRHNQQQKQAQRLQVRVGLDVGEPTHDEDDYFGIPVVIAKRLCDSAQGGQIVASDLVRRLVGSRGSYAFHDLGKRSLKGITEAVSSHEVAWEPAPEATREASWALPLPPLLAGGDRSAFVGRDEELAALQNYSERAKAGRLQLVLLPGEPGIGKTRLALEFARVAHAQGGTVLFGRSDAAALVPYQAFVEALQHYAAVCPLEELRAKLGSGGPALASLLPRLAERLPELPKAGRAESDTERYRLLEAVTSFLAEVAQAWPILLVLDDLHWADALTSLLLRHIVRSAERTPLLIVGTYRETELTQSHPFAETLADLLRDRAYELLPVNGLNEDEVGSLISARAGYQSSADLAHVISEQTEGNPFFIEEVVRHLLETGSVHEQGGRLTTDLPLSQLGIPQGVMEVVGRRLSRLSEECNSVLTIASVIGREFGLDALERASNLSTGRLLELLEEAVTAHIVTEVPHLVGRYSFSHALIYEALHDELTTTRRVHLHGQTLQYADNDGVKLAYEVLGASGPYVIALGISNCPAVRTRNWTTTQRWDRITRRCRLILYDRRGVGFSAAPESGYSLLSSVGDLRAVLDAVGVDRAVLWGATDGGPLALAFAEQHPERVAGLLLLGTTAKYASSGDFPWGVDAALMASFLQTDALDRGQAVSQLTQVRQGDSGAEDVGEVMARVPQQVWSKVAGGIGGADARSVLQRVHVPTLIIHDPDNQYIPVEAAHYLHEHIPESELEINEEYGLSPFGESVFRRIEEFIEEVTARSTG
ncbi:MAG: alpha/beta fold hydrolase [Chloroflexi bacterium]|nr:alpha/beta fold hydrolase [Chloroflexota bacterium]